jgi:hypothetical protein
MNRIRWTDEELADLYRMRRVEKKTWPQIVRHFGRSEWACSARLAIIEGRRVNNIPTGAARYVQPFETPPRRANDDALHLRLILEALRAGRAA